MNKVNKKPLTPRQKQAKFRKELKANIEALAVGFFVSLSFISMFVHWLFIGYG